MESPGGAKLNSARRANPLGRICSRKEALMRPVIVIQARWHEHREHFEQAALFVSRCDQHAPVQRLVGELAVEWQLPHGEMFRLLRRTGFDVVDLIELYPPDGAVDHAYYTTFSVDWPRKW